MTIFDKLRYFPRTEKWGNPDRMSGLLLLTLDAVRHEVGYPFVINSGFRDGDTGTHGKGEAVDFHVSDCSALEAFNRIICALGMLQISTRVGFGVYPQWNSPGFHLDVRGFMARWSQVDNKYVGIQAGVKLLK